MTDGFLQRLGERDPRRSVTHGIRRVTRIQTLKIQAKWVYKLPHRDNTLARSAQVDASCKVAVPDPEIWNHPNAQRNLPSVSK
jgi:hypothetical protein